jgi:cell division protein FtsA
MSKETQNIITVIDVGSAKTVVLAAETTESGLRYRAHGVVESHGTRKGVIADMDSAAQAVQKAVEEAEAMIDQPLDSVSTGISGAHIRAYNAQGSISLGPHPRDVQREDVRAVIDRARGITLPADRRILHLLPREFILDGQGGVREPSGMQASTLEVMIHVITAGSTAAQNVVTTLNRAGMQVEETIYEALASSDAVLRSDERELGAVVADIGAGSTDVVVFRDGRVSHSAVIPLGGDHFTNDVAVGLRTPLLAAEHIKRQFGFACLDGMAANNEIEVPSVGDRPSRLMAQHLLGEILEPRARELMELLRSNLEQAGEFDALAGGVVLTGGGARLQGFVRIAEQVLERQVRLGLPLGMAQLPAELAEPEFATAIGMIYYTHRKRILNARPETGVGGRLKRILSGLGMGS